MNEEKKFLELIDEKRMSLTIERLTLQIIEDYNSQGELCIIGIQPRGAYLASRIHQELINYKPDFTIHFGLLDITFYRDDFRRREKPLSASETQMNFIVENKNVLIIDDVLYTGRTINAALTALTHYGRAKTIKLLSLIERRFNREVPVQCDYSGIIVDALNEAYVEVNWNEIHGQDRVILFDKKQIK